MCIVDPTRIVLATRQCLYSPFLFPPLPPSFLPSLSFPNPAASGDICLVFYNLAPSPPSPACLSLSFSILFGSVHFSLECLSSQTPLCSGLPLLNTNKTRTTQVEQGARAQCDKRLTHHSITTAVNCPLCTLRQLPGTVAQPGSRGMCWPTTGWDGQNQQPLPGQRPFQHCH